MVKIGADIAGYTAKLQKMRKETKSMTSDVSGMMKASFAGLSFGAAVVGLKKLTSHAKELNRQAAMFGTSVENIQKLQHIAEKGGVAFDVIVSAMHDLREKAQDAANGNDELAKAFAMMGKAGEDFKDLDMYEMFMEFTKGVEVAEEKGLEFLAANTLIGGAAEELIPTFKLGAKALEGWGDAAVTMSDKQVQGLAKLQSKFEDAFTYGKKLVLEFVDAVFKAGYG